MPQPTDNLVSQLEAKSIDTIENLSKRMDEVERLAKDNRKTIMDMLAVLSRNSGG